METLCFASTTRHNNRRLPTKSALNAVVQRLSVPDMLCTARASTLGLAARSGIVGISERAFWHSPLSTPPFLLPRALPPTKQMETFCVFCLNRHTTPSNEECTHCRRSALERARLALHRTRIHLAWRPRQRLSGFRCAPSSIHRSSAARAAHRCRRRRRALSSSAPATAGCAPLSNESAPTRCRR